MYSMHKWKKMPVYLTMAGVFLWRWRVCQSEECRRCRAPTADLEMRMENVLLWGCFLHLSLSRLLLEPSYHKPIRAWKWAWGSFRKLHRADRFDSNWERGDWIGLDVSMSCGQEQYHVRPQFSNLLFEPWWLGVLMMHFLQGLSTTQKPLGTFHRRVKP